MKIAFPLANEQELAPDFVRAKFVGIYDEDKKKTDLIPLSGIEKEVGVTVFFDAMTCQGLHSVASPFYSYLSLRVFKENNITTLKAVSKDLAENIRLFQSCALKQFDVQESLLTGDCAKDCSGCRTSCH